VKPILGITMGDACGIGPEILLKAFRPGDLYGVCRPLVIGSLPALELHRSILGLPAAFRRLSRPEEARYEPGVLDVLDLGMIDTETLRLGEVTAQAGDAAVAYGRASGQLALSRAIDAIVSAPVNKEAMRRAGHPYEGQTQLLAELAGSKRYGMILLLGSIRVMMLTTHLPLRQACDAVTRPKVRSMLELADEALRRSGIPRPRLAVAALNPHGGEGGLFGREELDGAIPAIADAVAQGIDAVGPVPADTVFVRAREGAYDLVLAMYHDQANIAAKLLGFGEVVTLLAGVPFIRTSVGHGTAFDIAGRGVAREDNFVAAIRAAAELAVRGERSRT
jgi:4-hydroxythreonine-4-phosphate dehydrogenase